MKQAQPEEALRAVSPGIIGQTGSLGILSKMMMTPGVRSRGYHSQTDTGPPQRQQNLACDKMLYMQILCK